MMQAMNGVRNLRSGFLKLRDWTSSYGEGATIVLAGGVRS